MVVKWKGEGERGRDRDIEKWREREKPGRMRRTVLISQ